METIPARRGKATYVKRGQSIRIVNTHGTQVVDTWAFTAGMLTEFMSMEHTRATLTKLGGSIPVKAERTPAAFDRFVRSEMARWAPVLAATGADK